MLLNFDMKTDYTGERIHLKIKVCGADDKDGIRSNGQIYVQEESDRIKFSKFTKCSPKSGHPVSNITQVYLANLENIFWLSPRGNGRDCYRTWEALHFGRIPIVMSSELDSLFNRLPVLIIKSWDDITEDKLIKTFKDFSLKRRFGYFYFEKLQFSYWRDLILKESAYSPDNRSKVRRCFHPTTNVNNTFRFKK
jgi:hypothetical protein